MCLAVPGRIVEILGDGGGSGGAAAVGPLATVDFQGSRVEVSLAMAPQAAVGHWVLVHAGFAIAVLDEDEARQTWEYLQAGGAGEMPEQLRAGSGE
jgi:hydrogenase expression/formation protein HypC